MIRKTATDPSCKLTDQCGRSQPNSAATVRKDMSLPADYFQLSLRSGDSPTRMNSGSDVKLHRGCCGALHGRGVSKIKKSAGSVSGSSNSLYHWDGASGRKHPTGKNSPYNRSLPSSRNGLSSRSLSSASSTSSLRSRSSSSLSPPQYPHHPHGADHLERVREEEDDGCNAKPSARRKGPLRGAKLPPPAGSGRSKAISGRNSFPARKTDEMVIYLFHFDIHFFNSGYFFFLMSLT